MSNSGLLFAFHLGFSVDFLSQNYAKNKGIKTKIGVKKIPHLSSVLFIYFLHCLYSCSNMSETSQNSVVACCEINA